MCANLDEIGTVYRGCCDRRRVGDLVQKVETRRFMDMVVVG